jgi:hypothetical protein
VEWKSDKVINDLMTSTEQIIEKWRGIEIERGREGDRDNVYPSPLSNTFLLAIT